MFGDRYRGRRVVITGHTGFKGSWLGFWLEQLGAEVTGIALPMTGPNHFALLPCGGRSELFDIRDRERLIRVMRQIRPEMVFHLAAQPLVLAGYRDPAGTFDTNVMGTVNVLEAVRQTPEVNAVVVVTSDKCYAANDTRRPFREGDPLGGGDPYSASKGAAEIVSAAYAGSYFNGNGHPALVATARAGNVIGGGDWGADRLVPDLMRAAADGKTAELRHPEAVRPWQHVLEPLSGYLWLGAALLAGRRDCAAAWNFGPGADRSAVTVGEAAAMLQSAWPEIRFRSRPDANGPAETGRLQLDCSRADALLQWRGVWDMAETCRRTALWYRAWYREQRVETASDWRAYCAAAAEKGLAWTE